MHKISSYLIVMEWLRSDQRQVCRQMYRTPTFSATVVVVLAAGFGVSIAIFSIAHNVLLRPLPYNAKCESFAWVLISVSLLALDAWRCGRGG
jgi:hypothetical protein